MRICCALARPAMTDKLVILNLPHFNGLTREPRARVTSCSRTRVSW